MKFDILKSRWLRLALLSLAVAAAARAVETDPKQPRDWTWVHGVVFVPTSAVNEAQQWDEYDPSINDRELQYASIYGLNVVRVYLHYYVYLKDGPRLLRNIEDFLTRADKYGIKTEFVFFDDCWNQPSEDMLRKDYKYPAPIQGVHNSQWLVSPGAYVQQHYSEHRERLKSYVQDVVKAHKADDRITFWEIYNEPNKSAETTRLEKDAADWIKETGTKIPVTATGKEYSGEPYSDFRSWHQYGSYKIEGTAQDLNTECMNRQGQSVPGIVEHFQGKTGYIMWELGIGRDNCRFAWDEKREQPRKDEAVTPFHGIIYPDGHPWAIDDVRALLGSKFASTPFFNVTYFSDSEFKTAAKKSIAPFIDFELGDEVGTGSPDATARVPKDNFSTEYTGTIRVAQNGRYTISVESDGEVEIRLDGKALLKKTSDGRKRVEEKLKLDAGKDYAVTIHYGHHTGDAGLHVTWGKQGEPQTRLMPSTFPVEANKL